MISFSSCRLRESKQRGIRKNGPNSIVGLSDYDTVYGFRLKSKTIRVVFNFYFDVPDL